MKKIIGYAIFLALIAGIWMLYASKAKEVERLESEIQELVDSRGRDVEEKAAALKSKKLQVQGVQTFNGILLAFLSAGVVGIFFVFQVLPAIAHRFTHAIYDSAEMVEADPMHDARSLFAQGEYEAAIEAFKEAAEADPLNRFPWVEIAKIQRDNLKLPQAAVATLREALEAHEWEVSDAAYLMFRLAELYDEDLENRQVAAQILEQVCNEFPETRHAANARHKLHDWGLA
ncbi:MAG: tetratricopeptide repeat protein [Luteolibacter sp.]|jgi:tetratricopeptide (TPR) repeat protein